MTEGAKPIDVLLAQVEGREAPASRTDAHDRLTAACGLVLGDMASDAPPPADAARLAAHVEGHLGSQEAEAVWSTAAGLAMAEAAADFLDDTTAEALAPPAHLFLSARNSLSAGAEIVPLRRPAPGPVLAGETFRLLAAASAGDEEAILCRSQSGLWTIEVFVGQSAEDRAVGRGYLLLSVHADHRATYDGRKARVFVKIGNDERVLTEELIREGELYAEISLTGLELRKRDAVSVVFGPSEGEV